MEKKIIKEIKEIEEEIMSQRYADLFQKYAKKVLIFLSALFLVLVLFLSLSEYKKNSIRKQSVLFAELLSKVEKNKIQTDTVSQSEILSDIKKINKMDKHSYYSFLSSLIEVEIYINTQQDKKAIALLNALHKNNKIDKSFIELTNGYKYLILQASDNLSGEQIEYIRKYIKQDGVYKSLYARILLNYYISIDDTQKAKMLIEKVMQDDSFSVSLQSHIKLLILGMIEK